MRFNTFAVQYQVVDARERVVTKQKEFDTEPKRRRFLDRLEESGKLVKVLAFSNPQ